MAEPKFKPGDFVRFTMRFGDGSDPRVTYGTVLDATTINDSTPDGFYRVRSDMGVALMLPEEDLTSG